LSHWLVGEAVKRLGERAAAVASYHALYLAMAGLVVLSLAGMLGLATLRKREHLEVAS
jgi:hypothetical protein